MEEQKTVSITVGRMAECLHGEIMNSPDRASESIGSLMVGAMGVEPTPVYFGQRAEKAVITRGDRSDIQLGALETSIKCLVLTGGIRPIPMVVQRAEEKGVPIIVVGNDTPATLSELESCFGQVAAGAEVVEEGESAAVAAEEPTSD